MYFRSGLRLVLSALLSCFLLNSVHAEHDPVRPNIVLILADDMGFSDIGSYGGEIDTPNLDRLAGEGVQFSQFYTTARCSPTRASLLTGMYPHKAQMGHLAGKRFADVNGYKGDLDQGAATLPEMLRQVGYKNYMVGKWHLSNHSAQELELLDISSLQNTPLKRGFDEFYGTLLGGNNYFNPRYLFRNNVPHYVDDENYYYTDAMSEEATGFIHRHAESSKNTPFFLYVAYTAPHWPIQAPEKTVQKYRTVYQQGWDVIRAQRYENLIESALIDPGWSMSERAPDIEPWSAVENKEWEAERMAVHAAMVDHLDHGVGRVVRAIRKEGLMENTLFIFLSDNGASAEIIPGSVSDDIQAMFNALIGKYKPGNSENIVVGNTPQVMPGSAQTLQTIGPAWANASNSPFRKAKVEVHEGGIASPLIISSKKWKQPKSRINHTIGHVIDIAATILDAASVNLKDKTLDGSTLLPTLTGQEIREKTVFFEHQGNRAVRNGQWKLVASLGDTWELYNMKLDRTETNNLASKHPEIVKKLVSEYERYAMESNVTSWSMLLEKEVSNSKQSGK